MNKIPDLSKFNDISEFIKSKNIPDGFFLVIKVCK
jgi:hypothetical protein